LEKRFYEEYARVQDVHWWFVARRRILAAVLGSRLGPPGDSARRILDVGCGTGANLGMLRRFGRVVGVDMDSGAVELCRQRGWDVRLTEGAALPFGDGEFDLVTLLDVIEHVADDGEILGEARRVLAPGGSIMVTVPAYQWMWGAQDEISHHHRRYTRRRLLASLERSGLRPVRATYFNTVLFPPIAAIRLLRRLVPGPSAPRSDFEDTPPGRLNALLIRAFGSEAAIVPRLRLPFGVSVLALAEGPKGSAAPAPAP
jgi:SAM-dependent methyltransferase